MYLKPFFRKSIFDYISFSSAIYVHTYLQLNWIDHFFTFWCKSIRYDFLCKLKAFAITARQSFNLNPGLLWIDVRTHLKLIGNFEIASRAYVSRFNFKGNDQQKYVKDLSGGERNRLHLAKLLKAGGNMILLDEPTNDLDVETLRALENAILEFPGCVMCISHDRWFLDRIATHILDYRDEGQINFFDGNYTEYEEWLKKTLGAEAAQPKRIKYKKIG